jgi:hypothetical protein
MASRIEETSAQLEPTDELPVLKADVLRGIGVASASDDSAPSDRLDETVDALREALQHAESRWQQLESRVAAQDEAIALLRRALDLPTEASELQADAETPLTAAGEVETDATVEFRFLIDTSDDADDTPAVTADDALADDLDIETHPETDVAESDSEFEAATELERAAELDLASDAATDGEPTTRVPELTDIVAADALAADEIEAAAEPAAGAIEATADPVAAAADTEDVAPAAPPMTTESTSGGAELTGAEPTDFGLAGIGATATASIGDAGIDFEPADVQSRELAPEAKLSGKEQALLERVAELEAYVNGRADKWQAMEQALEDKAATIAELEYELEQRIEREANLEQQLHDEGARADALQDRLRRASLELDEQAEPRAESEGS